MRIKSWVILLYAFLGLFNSFIANDKPIFAFSDAGLISPCGRDFLYDIGLANKTLFNPSKKNTWAIYPPIPFHAQSVDAQDGNLKPLQGLSDGHLLGTDHLGRDVLAGLIRGCFNSFKIGLFAVLFSLLIGLLIGSAMAYYGNNTIRLTYFELILYLLVLFLGMFYLIFCSSMIGKISSIMLTVITLFVASKLQLPSLSKKTSIAVDSLFNNIIILRKSIPTLLLILAFLPLFLKPRAANIIIILSLIGWVNIARHTRAESMAILQKEFIQSSKLMGAGFLHILRYHIWPLIKPTLGVVTGFAFSSFLVIEASLSFLGIGLPPEEVSWGSMISIVRNDINLWRVALFPSLALFIIIYCFTTFFEDQQSELNQTII